MCVTTIVDGKVRLSGHNHGSIAGQRLVQDQEPDDVVRLLQTTCPNAWEEHLRNLRHRTGRPSASRAGPILPIACSGSSGRSEPITLPL